MGLAERLSTRILVCLVAWAAWAGARAVAEPLRVAAVQVCVSPEVYYGEEAFAAKMGALMARAMASRPDLVIFPEDVGTFLILAGAPRSARKARALRAALSAMSLGEWVGVGLRELFQGESMPEAVFHMRSSDVRRMYIGTFARLAARYRVYVVAGSCCLSAEKGRGTRNTAFVFGPEGTILLKQDKVHLVELEKKGGLDLTPGTVESLGVVKVKGEGIGVSVCYDTYFPEVTRALSAKGATVLVDIKANPWPFGPKTEKEFKDAAWKCVQEDTGIRFGVTSCLVGRLYDMVFEGRSAIVADGLLTADGSGYVAQARTFDQDEIVAAELGSNPVVRK